MFYELRRRFPDFQDEEVSGCQAGRLETDSAPRAKRQCSTMNHLLHLAPQLPEINTTAMAPPLLLSPHINAKALGMSLEDHPVLYRVVKDLETF